MPANDVYHARWYTLGTCTTSGCVWGSWLQEEALVQDCGNTGWAWGPNYCENNDIYHKNEYHEKGCNSAVCFDNITETKPGEPAKDCGEGCTCTATVECNCPPNAVIDKPPDPTPPINASGSVEFAGHGTDPDPGDTIKAHKWECAVLGASGSCPTKFPSSKPTPGKIKFTVNGQYTISYIVQDNHDAWDPTPDKRIITVGPPPPNNPPTADAGGPYEITLPTTTVDLDGSGSTDFEDCPLGGTNCPKLTYSWVIGGVVNTANCSTAASGVKPSVTCTNAGTANVTLTVTDSGTPGLSATAAATITVNAPANNPPNAVIDTPASDQTITQGSSVSFTGHGDDPDVGDTIKTHEWTCTVLSGVGPCPSGFPSAAEDPGSRTFNVVGQYRISYRVQDNHDAWDLTPATRTIAVNPLAAEPFLQITAFSADPLSFVAGGPALQFDSISIKVKNIGGAAVTPKVELEVLEALTDRSLSPSISSGQIICPVGSGSVNPDGDCTWGKSNFPGLSISSLGPGTYKLMARAFQSGVVTPDDSEALYFSIIRSVPTPELSEFLLPLIACVVLAIVLFSGRRQ